MNMERDETNKTANGRASTREGEKAPAETGDVGQPGTAPSGQAKEKATPEKARTTRDVILDTSLALFAQQGFEATSVRDIAAAVGIKAPSLYKHFASKQAIFDALVERELAIHAEMARSLGAPVPAEDESAKAANAASAAGGESASETSAAATDGELAPEAAVSAYANASTAFMENLAVGLLEHWCSGNAALFRRMLSAERFRSPDMAKVYRELFLDAQLDYETKLFEGMIKMGAFAPHDPASMALQFWAPILALMELSDCGTPQSELDQRIRTHVALFAELHTAKSHTPEGDLND